MINPTSYGIRDQDKWGSGAYGASRGKRKHSGVDFICNPGQNIYYPFDSGYMTRIARPYSKGEYLGCEISAIDKGKPYICKLFYFVPNATFIIEETRLYKGATIGTAQDISDKYPGMTCHVHLQVAHMYKQLKWFNPEDILEVPSEH